MEKAIYESVTNGGIEVHICKVKVSQQMYDDILENGIDSNEGWKIAAGVNIDKHSWHEYRDNTVECIVINILVAESFRGIEEGSFLRVEIYEE